MSPKKTSCSPSPRAATTVSSKAGKIYAFAFVDVTSAHG